MTVKSKLKLATMTSALLAMLAALAPVSAAPPHGDGRRDYNNNGRHFDGNHNRRFGYRRHNDRGFNIRLPGFRIYSGESSGCSYPYRKWQATGSRYWRSRYYDCRNG